MARVFALVVRCRIMMWFVFVALAKTPDDPSDDGCQDRRDTRRESLDGTVRGRPHRRPLNVLL